MNDISFENWLRAELLAARENLLLLYYQLDNLRFVELPKLDRKYMDTFGDTETELITEEIECKVMEKKQELLQTALNRRDPVDMAAIDKELETYREELTAEAEKNEYSGNTSSDGTPLTYEELDEDCVGELETIYKEIVRNYQPSLHPDLTQTEIDLYNKAQDMYRSRNLEGLKLVRDMLDSVHGQAEGGMDLAMEYQVSPDDMGEAAEDVLIRPDYSIAAELYDCFEATEDEILMQEEKDRCVAESTEVSDTIADLQGKFPFTARDTLNDPQKIEEYRQKLEARRGELKVRMERSQARLDSMMKEVEVHG